MKLSRQAMINDSLRRLRHAEQGEKPAISKELIELGVCCNGTTPSGATYIVPEPYIQKLCGHEDIPMYAPDGLFSMRERISLSVKDAATVDAGVVKMLRPYM